eukprot:365776-Chlamydomonas_euryale.AAC.19
MAAKPGSARFTAELPSLDAITHESSDEGLLPSTPRMNRLHPGLNRGMPCGGEAPHTGTTIMACVYDGGVVLGADGRVSVGNYISNRSSNKIAPLAERVFLLRSGSAPDAQIVSDHGVFGIV